MGNSQDSIRPALAPITDKWIQLEAGKDESHMTTLRSEEWSEAHLEVTDVLAEMLNQLRDLGYNPSLHLNYDRQEHQLVMDADLRTKHPEIQSVYDRYQSACDRRDEALEHIQAMPKLDLGF